jgi:hypothetical protein
MAPALQGLDPDFRLDMQVMEIISPDLSIQGFETTSISLWKFGNQLTLLRIFFADIPKRLSSQPWRRIHNSPDARVASPSFFVTIGRFAARTASSGSSARKESSSSPTPLRHKSFSDARCLVIRAAEIR